MVSPWSPKNSVEEEGKVLALATTFAATRHKTVRRMQGCRTLSVATMATMARCRGRVVRAHLLHYPGANHFKVLVHRIPLVQYEPVSGCRIIRQPGRMIDGTPPQSIFERTPDM